MKRIFKRWRKSVTPESPVVGYSFTRPSRPVNKVFIHCSASDRAEHDSVEVIRSWHLQRGWRDIGYHFYIKKDGTIQKGRDIELTPAAQEGHNVGSIAICLGGLTYFSQEQFDSLRELCRSILSGIPSVTFHGHCEVSSKTCPVFDYREVLNLDARGRIINK